MAYSILLANRIREALVKQPNVEEKTMFRGICFMVDGKMCVCASNDEMLCRIDPALFEDVLEEKECRPMMRNGKMMKGFVYVHEDAIKADHEFKYWLGLSLEFNKRAKATPKKKKNSRTV